MWNQWKSIGPASVSRIFFRCFIFDYCKISICKKGKVKDVASKKIRETMVVKLRSKMSIDLRFLTGMSLHSVKSKMEISSIFVAFLKGIQDWTFFYIFDWLIFHYCFKLMFRLAPLTSAAKSNEKLVEQKLCNSVLILDVLFRICIWILRNQRN